MSCLRPHRLHLPRSRGVSLRALLLATAFADELTTALLFVGLPLVRDRLNLSYVQSGLLFTLGGLAGFVSDPLINLLSDRGSKRYPILLGLFGLVIAFALAGVAPGFPLLLLAFILLLPASGAAVDLAQAALIELDTSAAGRTMLRWTLLSGIGDLLGPAAIGLLAGAGWRWPVLCAAGAACWLVLLAAIAPQRFPSPVLPPVDAEGEVEGTLAALRLAIRDGVLLRWVGIELAATMLDEVFIGFVALYFHDRLGAASSQVGFLILPGAAGALLTLAVLERLPPTMRGVRSLLPLTLLACAGMAVLLTTTSLWIAAAALIAIHAGAASWYPIARAAAYDRYPGRSGLVRTILGITAPIELFLPGVVGLAAEHLGIRGGVALLGIAPLAVLLLMPRGSHGTREKPPLGENSAGDMG